MTVLDEPLKDGFIVLLVIKANIGPLRCERDRKLCGLGIALIIIVYQRRGKTNQIQVLQLATSYSRLKVSISEQYFILFRGYLVRPMFYLLYVIKKAEYY
jgi:hypothetical protein